MSPQKRAINYSRVSTPRQAELYSLDYQLEQMRSYDEEMGLTVIQEFKDDHSGRKIERDYLEEACRMLENDEAEVLVTWRFDRLHRNYVNSVVLRDRIRRVGKEIHYAQSRQVSGETARQRLPEDLQYIMAEIEADDIAERTAGGRRRKIEVGGKWLGLNRPPFGYKKVGSGRDATVEIDENAAQVIRDIYEWFVNGQYGKPDTLREIIQRLNALQIPTPTDRLAHKTKKKLRGYGEWARGTLYKMLRDEAYTGTYYQYQWHMVDGKLVKNPNRDDWRAVSIPRILDQDLWEAAQRRLDQGRQFSKRNSVNEYLVGRRMRCECGYKLQSVTFSRTSTRMDGTTKTYRYHNYRCPGRHSEFERANRCTMPILEVDDVDAAVWKWVKEEIANPVILERKLREIQTGQKNANAGKVDSLRILQEHKTQIEQELKRLAMLYAREDMPAYLIDQLIADQTHKLGLTNTELARLNQKIETPLTDETISGLIAFSQAFQERLEAVEQSFEGRLTVIEGLEVTVEALTKDGAVWLRMKSILHPEGILQAMSLSSKS